MDGSQVGLGLRVVGDGDGAALAHWAVKTSSSVGAVASAVSAGSPTATGTALTTAAAAAAGAAGAAVRLDGESTSLRIDKIEPTFSGGGDTHLKQRVRAGSQ